MNTFSTIASTKQMQEMDKACMADLSISSVELMYQAAFAFYSKLVQDSLFINVSRLIILCGKGNNGGDGYCLASLFAKMGLKVFVFNIEADKQKSPDAEHFFTLCKQEPKIEIFSSIDSLERTLPLCDMVIDAVYGTQFRDSFTHEIEKIFQLISSLAIKKVAVDIPSGLCADKATLCPYAFKADLTITFELLKFALVSYPSCTHAGRVEVVDIGFSKSIKTFDTQAYYLTSDALPCLRDSNSHKGTYGKLLLACGSQTMTGAAFLAAMGALRFGVGLVYFACQKEIMPLMQMKLNETVFLPYDIEDKHSYAHVFNNLSQYSAIVHGCGFGTNPQAIEVTKYLIVHSTVPLIIDADAINILSQNMHLFNDCKCPLILTPHPLEMARLINSTANYVQNNRLEVAREFAKNNQCYLILKGARTIIACPDGSIYVNSTGNAGMARGGSGDILAGMVGAAIAQLSLEEYSSYNAVQLIKKALCSAVYNHGLAGDKCAKVKGQRAMIASDILDFIY